MSSEMIGNLLPTIVAIIIGGIVIIYTKKIHDIKEKQALSDKKLAESNQALAELKLEAFKDEIEYKKDAFQQTKNISSEIAHEISQQLINNPTWLDKFMDETGATYGGSVFGQRIRHFFYEKKVLAKRAVDEIENYFEKDDRKYCLLIDSGTSMYPLFHEISERVKDKEKKKMWQENACIITNNLLGVQYLMKNCKDDANDDYSDIALDCFLIPGKPLSVYGAVTGTESEEWVKNKIHKFLQNELKWRKRCYQIMSFVTGNYIAPHRENKRILGFYPVARGEGHVEIKTKFVEVSDIIFLLSPLMKFSFADVDLLNKVNKFVVLRGTDEAKKFPKQVKYERVDIKKDRCVFITSSRNEFNRFHRFSLDLIRTLKELYDEEKVIVEKFDLQDWIPGIKDNSNLELTNEIPHKHLRLKYEAGNDIWDINWVRKNI